MIGGSSKDLTTGTEQPVVRLLGDPLLDDGEHRIALVGMPGRILVALADAPSGRSIDQLIDAVWRDHPPRTARSALHVHLSSLRKALASVAPGLSIRVVHHRYHLALEGWRVDAHDVASAVPAASDALARGEAGEALDVIEPILAVWRGPAMSVGGSSVAPATTERLRLVRLTLEELRVEALLMCGDYASAEGYAIELVDSEDVREHRWAQLLRARWGQGRTADALATFQQARTFLIATLGIEPGGELVALERAVLMGQPPPTHTALEPPAIEGTAEPLRLDDIPSARISIVDRDREVGRALELLADGHAVQLIGAPGAGKSRIALAVIERVGDTPVAWIDFRNAPHRGAVDDDAIRWARRHPAGTLVIDNAERALADTSRLVRRIRRVAPETRLLITTRIPVADAVPMTIEPLAVPTSDDPAEIDASPSVRLLRSLLAITAPDIPTEPASLAEICRRMGGLPLGIQLAADLARTVPLHEIRLDSSPRLRDDVAAAVGAALDRLGSSERQAFSAMCLVAGQLDVDIVAALAGPDLDAIPCLTLLVDHGLVAYDASASRAPYSIPEPIREVGETLLDSSMRDAALDRLVTACLELTDRVHRRDHEGATLRDEVTRQLPWHRQALDHLAANEDDLRALQLVTNLELSLQALSWWDTNRELLDRALGISGPPSSMRAHALASRGRPGQFHLFNIDLNGAALDMAEQVGDDAEMARALVHLGNAHWWRGDHPVAISSYARARAHAEEARRGFLIGEASRFLGMALVTSGRHREGFEIQADLLRRAEQSSTSRRAVIPHLRMHLGHTRRHVGDLDAALADLARSEQELADLGNEASILHVAAGIAEVLVDLGRPDEALETVGNALVAATRMNRPNWDSWLLCSAMRAHLMIGRDELALVAAHDAVLAAAASWDGDQQRVGIELAHLALRRRDGRAAARILGSVDALEWPLTAPVRTLAELDRHAAATRAARTELGPRYDEISADGAASTLLEAGSSLLTTG